MEYIDYVTLSPLRRLFYRLSQGIRHLPRRTAELAQRTGGRIRKRALSFGRAVRNYGTIFRQGDIKTRLSFFIMGSGSYLRGQISKLLIFLFLQASFIF